MRKAFSLIEILLVLAILAVVVGLSAVAYKNIRSQSEDVALANNQKTFLRALEAYKSTGGDISAIILANSGTDTAVGQALLNALSSEADATQRETEGTVGNLLENASDMVAVSKTDEDGTPRLVVDASAGTIKLATSGSGFVVMSTADAQKLDAEASSYQTVTSTSATGAKYAQENAYVWDEDASGISGTEPESTGTSPTGTPSADIDEDTSLIITYADGGASDHATTRFYYDEYTDTGWITLSIRRSDQKDLELSDLSSLVLKFDDNTLSTNLSNATVKTNIAGIDIVQVKLTNLESDLDKKATAWADNHYALSVTATLAKDSDNSDIPDSKTSSWNIYARPITLNAPTISSSGGSSGSALYFRSGDEITIDSYTPNAGIVPSTAAVKVSDDEIDTSLSDSAISVEGEGTSEVIYSRNS